MDYCLSSLTQEINSLKDSQIKLQQIVFKLDETSTEGLQITRNELILPIDESRLARSAYLLTNSQPPETKLGSAEITTEGEVPDWFTLDESEDTEGLVVSDEVMQRLVVDGDQAWIDANDFRKVVQDSRSSRFKHHLESERLLQEKAQILDTTADLNAKVKQAKDDFYFLYDLIKDQA